MKKMMINTWVLLASLGCAGIAQAGGTIYFTPADPRPDTVFRGEEVMVVRGFTNTEMPRQMSDLNGYNSTSFKCEIIFYEYPLFHTAQDLGLNTSPHWEQKVDYKMSSLHKCKKTLRKIARNYGHVFAITYDDSNNIVEVKKTNVKF